MREYNKKTKLSWKELLKEVKKLEFETQAEFNKEYTFFIKIKYNSKENK